MSILTTIFDQNNLLLPTQSSSLINCKIANVTFLYMTDKIA